MRERKRGRVEQQIEMGQETARSRAWRGKGGRRMPAGLTMRPCSQSPPPQKHELCRPCRPHLHHPHHLPQPRVPLPPPPPSYSLLSLALPYPSPSQPPPPLPHHRHLTSRCRLEARKTAFPARYPMPLHRSSVLSLLSLLSLLPPPPLRPFCCRGCIGRLAPREERRGRLAKTRRHLSQASRFLLSGGRGETSLACVRIRAYATSQGIPSHR